MSEEPVNPSEERHTPPAASGDGAALPESGNTSSPSKAPPKRTLFQKARRYAFKTVKATALLTAITTPIRGTPGNMLLRGLQTTGILPAVGNVEGMEAPYKHVVDEEFARHIKAGPLPGIPLQPATVQNIVMEPSGEDIPVFLLHGERIGIGDALYRANTTLYHGQNVAASYYHTLKNITGREPEVKLLEGLVSEGIFFNGPHHALLNQEKTVVNNSVCLSSLDRTDDSSAYKAWIFNAAGNIGDQAEPGEFQSQPGGMSYHGPRSVLVGAPYRYSSHCGPVFFCDTAQGGRVKGTDPRIRFLPAAINRTRRDSEGRESISAGWGGTSNASPGAAARFSALMERYGHYLSEEQIFTALCYATAQSTQVELQQAMAHPALPHTPSRTAWLQAELERYYGTNLPGRRERHFYDPLSQGFGEITQAALEGADRLCQDMIRYRMQRPEAVCRPVTYKAVLAAADTDRQEQDTMYHYRVHLPEAVNLNNVVIQGTAATGRLDDASLYLVANQLKIRVPAGTTSAWREYVREGGDKSPFIGSTRGFTGSGPTDHIEVISSVPLEKNTCLTCYNTLGRDDAVSQIASLRSYLDQWEAMGASPQLADATPLDGKAGEPETYGTILALAPSGTEGAPRLANLQPAPHDQAPAPAQHPPDMPGQPAYWRRNEETRIVRQGTDGRLL